MPIVAGLMLLAVLVPADVWHHPSVDAVYRGFDPETAVVSEQSAGASNPGVVNISSNALQLTALPGSEPTVTLVTTPLSRFRTAMDVRVPEGSETGERIRIGIWSARANSGYFIIFGSANLVTVETIRNGDSAQTLLDGDVVRSQILGTYAVGLTYHLEIVTDKNAGKIDISLTTKDAIPAGAASIRLAGGPADPTYADVVSQSAPVEPGQTYAFGGLVNLDSGAGAYKLAIQWLDAERHPTGYANDWHTVWELLHSQNNSFAATAPQGAAYARLALGSSDATTVVFSGLFIRNAGEQTNLLPNADFQSGTTGWMLSDGRPLPPRYVVSPEAYQHATGTASDIPELFSSLRLSLTASASSDAGNNVAEISGYSLTLPHQRWEVQSIQDHRATALVILLLALALLLALRVVVPKLRNQGRQRFIEMLRNGVVNLQRRSLSASAPTVIVVIAGAALIATLNALLFSLGSHPFDVLAAKVWSYLTATSSPTALYVQPNTISLGKVWGGVPYHEAVFPYEFPMAYYASAIGWIYRAALAGPGTLRLDSYQLEVLIKSVNVVFSLIDAWLIYLILRRLGCNRLVSLLAACLWLFNPAVWFSTSVWGQNHVFSVCFLLLAVWLLECDWPLLAWLALIICGLTRPQMLIPAFLIGVVFLRRFSVKRNVYAISWSVIIVFVLMFPFSLAYGPSNPVDLLRFDLQVQEAGGNEPELTTVSLDTYSVWPLVDIFASGAVGRDRFQQSSDTPFVGRVSYLRASQVLTVLAVGVAAGMLLLIPGESLLNGDYLVIVALGTIAFLVLKTGLAPTHYVLGLPLLLVCRRSLRGVVYFGCIGIWSATTFVAMYGAFGNSITAATVPALYAANNATTAFVKNLYSSDWFISVACLQNLLVVVYLGWAIAPRLSATRLWLPWQRRVFRRA